MKLELVARNTPSPLFSILSPLLALALTLIAGAIMFASLGADPIKVLQTYFIVPLADPWLRDQIIIKATPLILIAVGLSICYRCNNWNIGAEGQYLIGGAFGSIIPVYFNEWSSVATLPLVMLCGMVGGALFAAIPALLKTRFGANEILTSLMLVYVAQQIVDWLVRGPWRDPNGFGFPGSKTFSEGATLPKMFAGSEAHFGAVFAVIAAVVAAFVLARTLGGFQVRVVGLSPRAGAFAGFDAKRLTLIVFLISGALAGLAGISEVAGASQKLHEKLSLGYGFTAIIVAFLGRLNPLGILAAGLVLALSYIGGEEAKITLQVSDRATHVFQGLLLFFVLACDTLIHYRIRLTRTHLQPAAGGG